MTRQTTVDLDRHRTPSARLAVSLATTALLTCASPSDEGGPGYQLRDVDGVAVPLILDSTYAIEGVLHLWLLSGGLLLRADSTALWTSRVRLAGPVTDTTWENAYERIFHVTGDSIELCGTMLGVPPPCLRGSFSSTEIVMPAAFDGPPGGGRRYRYATP
jgi:hypothetical protein